MLGTWNLLHKGEKQDTMEDTAREYGNHEGNRNKGQRETETVCTQKMTRKQAAPGEHARHDIHGTRT